jgi:small-conductance mechanosensitive channel
LLLALAPVGAAAAPPPERPEVEPAAAPPAPAPVPRTGFGFTPARGDPGEDVESALEPAPVVVDGHAVLRVRGASTRPAEARAAAIADRIRAAARDASLPTTALASAEVEIGTLLSIGGRPIMVVTEPDATLEGAPRPVVARLYLEAIQESIERYRAERTPDRVLRQVGYAAGGLVLLLGALLLLARVLRGADRLLEARVASRLHDVGIQSVRLVSARAIWSLLRALLVAAGIAVGLAAVYGYATFALARFPGTRAAAGQLGALALRPLLAMGNGLVAALPGILFLVVLAVLTRYLLRVTHLLFDAIARGAVVFPRFDREWAMPTYRIARLFVVALALVVAYPHIPGSQSNAFKGISILLGVMFSLGSSSFVANVIAGYSMTYRRAFRVGDLIRSGDAMGVVSEIRLQVTHLRSPKNEEIIVPNSTLLQSTVVNYSTLARDGGLVLHTEVGIGYETPWRQVEAMLLLAADRAEGFLKEPRPFVRNRSLGDFAVVYELNAHTKRPTEMPALYTELHRHILDVFNEYGVQIMTPAYEGDPEKPKLVPKEQWFLAPATRVEPPVTPDDGRPRVTR